MVDSAESPDDPPAFGMGSMTFIRSLVYNVLFYATMGALGIILSPITILSRSATIHIVRNWCAAMLVLLRWTCGLRTEIRGEPPPGNCIVASKHQSFLDILMLVATLDAPRFVMKQELRFAPVFGWYAKRLGCIPVDRGAGRVAMDGMLQAIDQYRDELGQLVIYPQGTRVAPGARRQYRMGAAVATAQTGLPCIPAATNAGLFWGRNRFLRHPGVAVVEFLEPLPEGLTAPRALVEMERRTEAASDALMAEAASTNNRAPATCPGSQPHSARPETG